MRKLTKYGLGIFLLMTLLYFTLPQVDNPNPVFQTKLIRGKPIDEKIEKLLTPHKEPSRERAIVILQSEKLIYEYGPTDKIMNIASIRKSIMGLLYGIAIDQGLLDINMTLAELGIDEHIPLTEVEKTANIEDLLMAKSGIYLPAQGEHDTQISDRPERGSHKPGDYFFMNNFDANALGTIFSQETGTTIGTFMEKHLAAPLGMQDFSKKNVIVGAPWFLPKKKSMHKQYFMYLSTRDLARIGAMVANNGKWNGTQVISSEWIQKSITAHYHLPDNHINYGRYDGFGYQWWLQSETNSVWSDGYGERFLIINPDKDLTLVEQNFTGNSYLTTMLWMIGNNNDSGLGNLIGAHAMLAEDQMK